MRNLGASIVCGLAFGLVGCQGEPGPSPATLPVLTPTASPLSAPSETPGLVTVTVYFTDSARFALGTPPFETAVTRTVPTRSDLPAAVLDEFFGGPTPEEQAMGLERIASGFTGYSSLQIEGGIARVHLLGPCASNGATYTIAQPILANLLPFSEIDYVKIYDEEGTTEDPVGMTNSIPVCLEP